jgi:hypothetical protein
VDSLFTTNRDFNGPVKRNIVSLRESEDLLDDISGGNPRLSRIAQALEAQAKQHPPSGVIARAFHYSTAIEYPFVTEPWQSSRYSNGAYPSWYGSLDLETTIYETCHHMVNAERGIAGLNEVVYRERAVYDVDCRALLIDLIGKEADHPDLIGNDYALTQAIGQRLHSEGHPGLIAPSSRRGSGENVIIFRQNVLNNPRIMLYLIYKYDPSVNVVTVERTPGKVLMEIDY